jgi:hypothetical protein
MAVRASEGQSSQGRGQGAHLIGLILADAGYCSEDNLPCDGPDRLIAPGKHRDLEIAGRGRRKHAGPHATKMTEWLQTDDGIAVYRRRGHIAETPHAQIKHNMGLPAHHARQGQSCCRMAFRVHRALFKAITAGHLTADALGSLTG